MFLFILPIPTAPGNVVINENANGLLREFFPKALDLAIVTEEELMEDLILMNKRPRKCLGWKTAFEAFMEELSHLN